MIEVQTQVTQNTEALKGAQTEVSDLRRQLQTLEIELESQKSLVRNSVSATLHYAHYVYRCAGKLKRSLFKSPTATLLTQAFELRLLVVKTLTLCASSLTADRKPLWKGR